MFIHSIKSLDILKLCKIGLINVEEIKVKKIDRSLF